MKSVRSVSLVLFAVLSLFATLACGDDGDSEVIPAPSAVPDQLIGQQLPEATGEDLAGSGVVKLSSFRVNIPLVVAFWLSDCPDCKAEMPRLQAVADRVKAVRFVSVAIDDPAANEGSSNAYQKARAFSDAAELTMPAILVPRAEADPAFNLYRIPTVILVDSSGIVAKTFVWPFTTAEVEAAAAALR